MIKIIRFFRPDDLYDVCQKELAENSTSDMYILCLNKTGKKVVHAKHDLILNKTLYVDSDVTLVIKHNLKVKKIINYGKIIVGDDKNYRLSTLSVDEFENHGVLKNLGIVETEKFFKQSRIGIFNNFSSYVIEHDAYLENHGCINNSGVINNKGLESNFPPSQKKASDSGCIYNDHGEFKNSGIFRISSSHTAL